MIVTTHQSRLFEPGRIYKRYVRAAIGSDRYEWCMTNSTGRWDVAQGICDADDIPADVKRLADARRGQAFSYVIWPEARE